MTFVMSERDHFGSLGWTIFVMEAKYFFFIYARIGGVKYDH